jgi:asparagine synthase (glutamine-hydrolysing)
VGQARLSITGVSLQDKKAYPHALRKMRKDKEYLLVFNGEIYNYKYLKKQLKNCEFKTKTDTEVLLEFLIKKGVDGVKELDGQFSFFFYDSEKDICFLARDLTGKKPLYFSLANNFLRFSSEPEAIVKTLGFEPNIKNIAGMLTNSISFATADEPLGDSYYNNVEQLCPGQVLIMDKYGKITKKNNDLISTTLENKNIDERACIKNVKKTLVSAVKKRIPNEVPVGVTLSGGLDSSIITSLVSVFLKKDGIKLIATSTFYDDQKENEDYFYAAKLVSYLDNVKLIKVHISSKSFLNNIDEIVSNFGICSSIRQLAMFENYREMKKRKIKVVLIGEGADEFNWGYWHKFTGFDKVKKEGEKSTTLAKQLIRQSAYAKELIRKDVLKSEDLDESSRYLMNMLDSFPDPDDDRKMMKLYATFFINFLNKANDRLSMKNSVEVRMPFQDVEFIKLCLQIPKYMQVNDNTEKIILRKAFKRILPKEIAIRRKKVYPAADSFPYHQAVLFEFERRLKSTNNNFWKYFNKPGWLHMLDLYEKKIASESSVIQRKINNTFTRRRELGEKVDLVNGDNVKTDDIFKLLTIIIWFNQNYGRQHLKST